MAYEWELPLPKAPKYPDPNDRNQLNVNVELVKIASLNWRLSIDLYNKVKELQKTVFELKKFVEGD